MEIEEVNVTSDFAPDPALEAELEKYSGVVEGKMTEELGELSTPLDGRFSSVRTAETNLGNLMCDVMLAALQADCSLLNAGTVRSNIKHSKGEFKLRVSRLSF